MKKTLVLILTVIIFTFLGFGWSASEAPKNSLITLYVTASRLNGRTKPSKKAPAEAMWEEGDKIRSTGKWSRNHEWIEVEGGETAHVWCYYSYLTEELTPYIAVNQDYPSIKIRSKPYNGKLRGYLKKGESVEITQVVLGWGKCDRGWIDLGYLKEEDLEP